MNNTIRKPEDNEREQLENEIVRLKKKVEKYEVLAKKQYQYGLVWLDVPEAFENEVENKLPILKEEPKLAINSKDNKPTHLLIEGDNYHALTCLNYTHKGKVDVIYIDPPYNTGSDGFKYKDKRILKEYPDGTPVPVEHPLRHSYWLSFMKKRFELVKDLLTSDGVIFISIDDNELAQLKLLCDEVFLKENFIAQLVRVSSPSQNIANFVSVMHDYCLVYSKDKRAAKGNWRVKKNYADEFEKRARSLLKQGLFQEEIAQELRALTKYPRFYDFDHYYYVDEKGVYQTVSAGGVQHGNTKSILIHPATKKPCKVPENGWRYKEEEIRKLEQENKWHFGDNEKTIPRKKLYLKDYFFQKPKGVGFYDSQIDKRNLKKMGIDFDFPKPVAFLKWLLEMVNRKEAVVLDFFAGSGSTAQAVMELNDDDGGKRQFILITNNDEVTNEKKHRIMTDICYPRIKKIIKGYKSYEGLGNSVRYFKTAFVGKNNILKADDADKIELAHNAGGMLAIAENTYEPLEQNDYWQIFESEKQYTAIYFREEFDGFDDFVEKVRKLKKPAVVYIFSWEKEFEFNDFVDDKNIRVKAIPQPILEIYKEIYNLI